MHHNTTPDAVTQLIAGVKSAPTPRTRGGFGDLILKLTRIRPLCNNDLQITETDNLLNQLCHQYLELSKHYADFLDIPLAGREALYRVMSARGAARDTCHLGELMLLRSDDEGAPLILRAAIQGDPRAAFIYAKLLAEGMYGSPRDPQKATGLLQYAARKGYAPALELIAALYWDGNGNWNFPRNRDKAQQYMNAAVELYSKHSFTNTIHKTAYENHCRCMKHVAGTMQRLRENGLNELPHGFCPSYLALLLSFYPLNSKGLRARAHYICEYMAHYGRTFYLGDYYWRVRLPLISLSLEPSDFNISGCTHTGQKDDKICFIININPIEEEQPTSEPQYWEQQYRVNTTLAHELAHCSLNMEFNHQLNIDHPLAHTIAEGHATNCQYQFARLVYHKGILTPADFARSLTPEYQQYFMTFRRQFINPKGMADWHKIATSINAMNQNCPDMELRQLPFGEVFEPPTFYGLGFKGYV